MVNNQQVRNIVDQRKQPQPCNTKTKAFLPTPYIYRQKEKRLSDAI